MWIYLRMKVFLHIKISSRQTWMDPTHYCFKTNLFCSQHCPGSQTSLEHYKLIISVLENRKQNHWNSVSPKWISSPIHQKFMNDRSDRINIFTHQLYNSIQDIRSTLNGIYKHLTYCPMDDLWPRRQTTDDRRQTTDDRRQTRGTRSRWIFLSRGLTRQYTRFFGRITTNRYTSINTRNFLYFQFILFQTTIRIKSMLCYLYLYTFVAPEYTWLTLILMHTICLFV